MGTRGFLGFVAEGKTVITYNHFDSYPSGLGVKVLDWLAGFETFDAVKALVSNLREVSDEAPPTEDQLKALAEYHDEAVTGNPAVQPNWYQLLRGTQGDPSAILACGYYESAADFPDDSLFCEWGYLIDLDAMTFEVFEGFQTEPHEKGRFTDNTTVREPSYEGGKTYYPVALRASWPLDKLPTPEAFNETFNGEPE